MNFHKAGKMGPVAILALAIPLCAASIKNKESAPSKDAARLDLVEARVVSVLRDPEEKGWMVVLAPKSFKFSKSSKSKLKDPAKVLVIGVGESEGTSILLAIHNKATIRPLTHELFAKVLGRSGVSVVNALIHTMSDKTFYARLDLAQNGKKFSVDCRPSDGISLALRASGKIYVLRKIFEEAGFQWPSPDGAPRGVLREEPL
ncbi:MAG: bifunctional nuclease family protein [Elusimicrobiota bacterium]